MDKKPGVTEHEEIRHLTEIVIDPAHAKRTESPLFRKSKAKLKADGHYQCWVCGSKKDLQVHHFGCEWSLVSWVDFDKLKALLQMFDVYGYSALYRQLPLTSVDDIRNMLVLCQTHHTGGMTDGVANGIHQITFPVWIMQKIAKDGEDPVPDDVQELKKELEGGGAA